MGEIEGILDQLVKMRAELDIAGLEEVFSDGSKIKANASVKSSKTVEKMEKIQKITVSIQEGQRRAYLSCRKGTPLFPHPEEKRKTRCPNL